MYTSHPYLLSYDSQSLSHSPQAGALEDRSAHQLPSQWSLLPLCGPRYAYLYCDDAYEEAGERRERKRQGREANSKEPMHAWLGIFSKKIKIKEVKAG